MDSYIPKPLRPQQLYEIIDRIAATVTPANKDAANKVQAEEPAFDREALLARVEGDHELLREIVGLFLDEAPELLRAIRAAVEKRDAVALERAAHTLKGSIGNFGDESAFRFALRLETLGRSGDLAAAPESLAKLEEEVSRLAIALAALRDGLSYDSSRP